MTTPHPEPHDDFDTLFDEIRATVTASRNGVPYDRPRFRAVVKAIECSPGPASACHSTSSPHQTATSCRHLPLTCIVCCGETRNLRSPKRRVGGVTFRRALGRGMSTR